MADIFESVLGARLILPHQFDSPDGKTLSAFAGTRRLVMIKSSSYKGWKVGSHKWATIVALWKPATHPLPAYTNATVCKSLEAPGPDMVALARASSQVRVLSASAGSLHNTRTSRRETSTRRSTAHTSRISQHGNVLDSQRPEERSLPSEEQRQELARELSLSGKCKASRRRSIATRRMSNFMWTHVPQTLAQQSSAAKRLGLQTNGHVEPDPRAAPAETSKCFHATYQLQLQRRVQGAVARVESSRAGLGQRAKANFLVKVYPPKLHESSENYDPVGGFDAKASLIALNMQGKATSRWSRLSSSVMRGEHASRSDRCSRDRVQAIENMFLQHGQCSNHAESRVRRACKKSVLPVDCGFVCTPFVLQAMMDTCARMRGPKRDQSFSGS